METRFWSTDFKMVDGTNEELLVKGFETTSDPLAFYDENYRLIRVNKAFATLFRLSAHQLVGEYCYKVIYKRDSRCEMCHAGEIFRIGKPQIWEEKRRLPDGRMRYFEVYTSPIQNHRGHTTLAVMHRHDITNQKRNENRWENSARKYRTIVEMAREGIFVLDIEAKVTYANTRFLKMLGYTLEEVKGQSLFDFMSNYALARAKFERTPDGLVDIREMRFEKKEGGHFVAQMSMSSLKDNNGFVGTVGIVTDISHLKGVEAKLRSAKEFNEKIINSITDSLIVIDPETYNIVQANEHFLKRVGLELPHVLTKACYEVMLGRSSPCETYGIKCPVRTTARNRQLAVVERSYRDSQGIERTLEVTTYPLLDSQENVNMVIRLEHDITDRRKMEKTLASRTDELEKTHHQLKTLFEISSHLTAMGSLEELVQYILKTSHRIFPGSESLFFILNTEKDRILSLDGSNPGLTSSLERIKQRIEAVGGVKTLVNYLNSIEHSKITSAKDLDIPPEIEFISEIYDKWSGLPIMMHQECIGYFLVGSNQSGDYAPEDLHFLHAILSQVGGHIRHLVLLESEINKLRQQVKERTSYGEMVGMSKAMQKVYNLIDLVADSDVTVLISGESGTGKELVAQAIHLKGHRHKGPFVVAHCAGFSPTLLESELFGHEKGAFTGAIFRKKGRIERANEGTLFFDEIGEISPATQVLLLRFLENHLFERVGGERGIEADVRVIAATNRNLQHEVQAARFRKDLYYRLNVITVHLPPLRERKEDIPLLTHHFIEKHCLGYGKKIGRIAPEEMQILMDYDWPGNVRQLENAINHAIVLAQDDRIQKKHLPKFVAEGSAVPISSSLAENESQLILRVLNEYKWNKYKTANHLQISRSTLYSKMHRYNLNPSAETV